MTRLTRGSPRKGPPSRDPGTVVGSRNLPKSIRISATRSLYHGGDAWREVPCQVRATAHRVAWSPRAAPGSSVAKAATDSEGARSAEPAPHERQPGDADDGLGADRDHQEQPRDAEHEGRDGPFDTAEARERGVDDDVDPRRPKRGEQETVARRGPEARRTVAATGAASAPAGILRCGAWCGGRCGVVAGAWCRTG